MRGLRSYSGALALVLIALVGLTAALAVRVERTTRPERHRTAEVDFESTLLRARPVRFPATDGVELSAWALAGRADAPVVILAHDRGGSKADLLPLAARLQQAGFGAIALDLRGHGESEGSRSTLGIEEKRDILGAIDYLTGRGQDSRPIAAFGVGMGAHAAVLAAAERPAVRALVLDGLYPDAGFEAARELYADWSFGRRHLRFVADYLLTLVTGSRPRSHRAADQLSRLQGRDVLLLGSSSDDALLREIKRMYHDLPQGPDAEGNLVLLPATLRDGVLGDQLTRYNERVSRFLVDRLLPLS
jgi:pimeloyl-ACP methyl ester carboxylesterase